MKKIFIFLAITTSFIILFGTSEISAKTNINYQPILAYHCCDLDQWGYPRIRCVLYNGPVPQGILCRCVGIYGDGFTCY